MPLTKLQFKPGINREVTSYTNEGGWHDGDKVRFNKGFPEKIGGWQKYMDTTFLGTCRDLHMWTGLDSSRFLGIGTHLKFYIESGGELADMTPIRLTSSAGDVTFAATSGSTTITVTHVNHGADVGEYVTYSGAISLGGAVTAAVLNAEFAVTAVNSTSEYEIEVATAANASDTGNGGSAVVGEYQIPIGLDTVILGNGWGTDGWGEGGWGDASSVPIVSGSMRIWTQDNYGEDLLYNIRDGGIYYWDRTSGLTERGVALSSLTGANTTPTIAKQVLTSDRDRHVIAFGCDDEFSIGTQDPLLIRFSDKESLIEWSSQETNSAGSLRLGSGSEFITAVETRQQIAVFTDTTLYAMQYVGAPFFFGVSPLSESITIISSKAAVAVQDNVFWMGRREFYAYTGAVSRLPCSVRDYVFEDLDLEQAEKIVSGANTAHSEVWWFYPSKDGTGDVDKYVVYNYGENLWYYGTLSRSFWMDRGVNEYPIATGNDGYLYEHEYGFNDGSVDPSVAIESYIESSPMDLGDGHGFTFISRLIPDLSFKDSTSLTPSVDMTLTARNFSDGTFVTTDTQTYVKTQTVPIDQRTEQLFFRLRGRQFNLKVTSNDRNVTWRLGSPRVDIRQDGRR